MGDRPSTSAQIRDKVGCAEGPLRRHQLCVPHYRSPFWNSCGDTGALVSLNIVFAALLGRSWLGEELRLLQVTAVLAAFVGAVFISQPEVLFGKTDDIGGMEWVGYICSVLSGFFYACVIICVRVAPDISVWHFSFSVFLSSAVTIEALYQVNLLEDFSFEPVFERPMLALGWSLLIVFLNPFSSVLLNLGAALCPAALAAIVNSACLMSAGYLAQVFIFDAPPNAFALTGVFFHACELHCFLSLSA